MRNPPKKTERGMASHESMLAAAVSVIDGNTSLRKSAAVHRVHYSTLCRYIKRVKESRSANLPAPKPG